MSEPSNQDRARWANNALRVFAATTWNGENSDTMHGEDLECAIADLVCDLLHLADQKGLNAQKILWRGNAHFEAELFLDG
ncbi:hypothetical protein BH10PLA2_BH10PLA2_34800 [soil metagenome]